MGLYAPTQPGTDTSGVGVANMQALTLLQSQPYEPPPGVAAHDMTDADQMVNKGNPTLPLLGLIAGLVVLGIVREKSEHLKSNTIAFNAFNFIFVIFTVMIGIALAKVVFTKYPVPGVTALVHAV